ncbi:hypothetical protein TA3x_001985 [Tundrisphaera sp. TA3]|uniref:hypothetical protein n=1 Tax=Tundrisphaera sp. TA3 TaxID=3435775 RepID=UPI003EB9F8DA
MSNARLKETIEVHLPRRLAMVLEETAEAEGTSKGTIAALVLGKWAAMIEAVGQVSDWRPVPVDDETSGVIADYAAELGDDETLHLGTALVLYFHEAALTKKATGSYGGK